MWPLGEQDRSWEADCPELSKAAPRSNARLDGSHARISRGAAPGGSSTCNAVMFGNLVMKRANDAGPLSVPERPHRRARRTSVRRAGRTEGGERQLAYLTETHPITEKVMKLAGSGAPHEVLRVAAHCIEGQCPHWNGEGCRLAMCGYDAAARGFSAAALCYSPALSVVQAGRTGGMRQVSAGGDDRSASVRCAWCDGGATGIAGG